MKKIIPEQRKTAPLIAFFLSILLVGLGQIVNGQKKKGFIMLIVAIILNVLMLKAGYVYIEIIKVLIFLYAGFDAYKLAKNLKEGKTISEFQFFY